MRRFRIRLVLGILLALIWPYSALAGFFCQYLTSCAFVVQRSPRYAVSMYNYYNEPFNVRGCGPASAANAFAAACSLQQQTDTDQLLRELMRTMCYNHTPAKSPISADGIRFLMDFDEAYQPLLAALRGAYAPYWHATAEEGVPEAIMEYLSSAREEGAPALYACCYTLHGKWGELAGMARELAGQGLGDAIVTLCLLSTGTEGTPLPFRVSDGHYETLCFCCGEFAEDGSVYLIDSMPRALPWEEKVRGTYFDEYRLDSDGEMLSESFEIERITPSVIRLRLREDIRMAVSEIGQAQGAAAGYLSESLYLEKLRFYGTGNLIVTIPRP